MRTQRPLAGTPISQGVKPFHQFIKQVTLFRHAFLLVLSSPFTRSFSSARCLGDKSAISSLSYSVNNQNSGPPLQ
jgi:hypothetical protein